VYFIWKQLKQVYFTYVYCSILKEIKLARQEMGYVKGRTGRIRTVVRFTYLLNQCGRREVYK
jgi:predicted RNA-binding protein YlqC (UPF0109 family)